MNNPKKSNPPEKPSNSILIIAGESSGEKYGANLVKEFKKIDHSSSFFGIGGNQMKNEGVELLFTLSDVSLVGLFEVLTQLLRIKHIFNTIIKEVKKRKPSAAVLIDFPDFNLRIAKKLNQLKIPVLYYISPTIWAWREGRIKQIKKYINQMLLIFPFEEEIYQKYKIKAKFIGHPLLERIKIKLARDEFLKKYNLSSDKKIITLMPGSRESEVKYHLPVVMEAVKKISSKLESQFLLIKAENLDKKLIEKHIDPQVKIITEDSYETMANSDLIIASCGTANLEAALLEKPLITFYRVSPLSYRLGINLVKINTYSIVNILAGKKIIPELIQKNFTTENIYSESMRILNSPDIAEGMKKEFKRIKKMLGEKGASKKAALALKEMLAEKE
ncbi:MAG: lipid-A-disaccharide synthase [Candidatus Aminicenantia bacterium]